MNQNPQNPHIPALKIREPKTGVEVSTFEDKPVNMTNVEDMDTYISSYIVQNRASPFADRDLIIRNPEELNRTRVTTRDSYTLVKYVSLFQKTWTWTDYHQDVRTVAKAFISLGFARYGWIKNQLFQRNPTFLPPDSTVCAYWASMLLNG